MTTHIDYTIKEHVAWITINRPEVRNAIALQTSAQIAAAVEEATRDVQVRAIIVTGAGARVFSAGADLQDVTKTIQSSEGAKAFDDAFYAGHQALVRCPKPTIARIQGHAIGGGLLLASACDLRIAHEKAKLGYPVARLGLIFSPEQFKTLVNLVGSSRAKWMLFSAEMLTARQAEAWGLVDRVVEGEHFVEAVERLIQRIVQGAPLSIEASKAIIDQIVQTGDVDDAFVQVYYDKVFSSADLQEGFSAMREKRAPVFRGQ